MSCLEIPPIGTNVPNIEKNALNSNLSKWNEFLDSVSMLGESADHILFINHTRSYKIQL